MIAAKKLNTNEKYHVGSESFNFDDRTHVINHIDTFCILDRRGNVHPEGKKAHGIFYKGTRYLNKLELEVNHRKLVLLSSSIKSDNEVLSVDMTNPDLEECGIKENNLHINRQQFIRNGVYYEEMEFTNFSETTCSFTLNLLFDADFADIFEVRGMKRTVKVPKRKLKASKNKICFEYEGNDGVNRKCELLFNPQDNGVINDGAVDFSIGLKPKQNQTIAYAAYFKNSEVPGSRNTMLPSFDAVKKYIETDIKQIRSLFAHIQTDNENFNNWLLRSRTDLQSLLAETNQGLYPYAGVPWYNTAFGRDGIITAMELLWIAPNIAKDTLLFLASTQAKKASDSQDAEPGKIIHEIRSGEMANTGEVPFKQYYGTIDATPLFLMLAGMYYVQTADLSTIKKIWSNIKAAVTWIDKYGDLDGDGFVEYQQKSKNGLTNQGWKDSYDSIMYKNGDLCEAPIALCEVQGYVYAAKKYVSLLAQVLAEDAYAQDLEKAATRLKMAFNEKFWDEELGAYVLALDKNKQPCKVMASNAGHCLFTGIAEERHAQVLAKSLTSPEIFSGWGIRTLAKGEVRYNPVSYHNGSVWPHDNALIAYGMSKYDCKDEAVRIFKGFFEAAFYLELQRMPELFCGFERRQKQGPTAYPVACSPQAWAVGIVFLLLQSLLGLQIDGVKKQIVFNKPQLPDFLNKVTIQRLALHNEYCDIEMYRHKHDVGFHIIRKPADWEVIIKS